MTGLIVKMGSGPDTPVAVEKLDRPIVPVDARKQGQKGSCDQKVVAQTQ